MTAPLPPHWLDVIPETRAEVREYAEEFAKLAVRQALGRVEKQLIEADDGGYWYAEELACIPRAIIKEYSE